MAELQRAFISPDMISVGDSLIEAVVTAGRWPEDGLVITIRPVEAPTSLASLMVVIDERDLAEVQKLLGQERQVLPMAWEDDLAVAMRALRNIAEAEHSDPDNLKLTWKDIALSNIDLAQKALEQILVEADDGTPSDS